MEKECWHCNGPISLTRRLKGERFCSRDHEHSYDTEQSERAVERVKTAGLAIKTRSTTPQYRDRLAPSDRFPNPGSRTSL
jgi:hypothetical protein